MPSLAIVIVNTVKLDTINPIIVLITVTKILVLRMVVTFVVRVTHRLVMNVAIKPQDNRQVITVHVNQDFMKLVVILVPNAPQIALLVIMRVLVPVVKMQTHKQEHAHLFQDILKLMDQFTNVLINVLPALDHQLIALPAKLIEFYQHVTQWMDFLKTARELQKPVTQNVHNVLDLPIIVLFANNKTLSYPHVNLLKDISKILQETSFSAI